VIILAIIDNRIKLSLYKTFSKKWKTCTNPKTSYRRSTFQIIRGGFGVSNTCVGEQKLH